MSECIIFILASILIIVVLLLLIRREQKTCDLIEPLDDSGWNRDTEIIKSKVKRFLGSKEDLVGVLGSNHIDNVVATGEGEGFGILTNKAIYFIGKVVYRKGILLIKSSVQRRIHIRELRGVLLKKIINPILWIPLAASAVMVWVGIKELINVIKLENDSPWFYVGDIDSDTIFAILIILCILIVLTAIFIVVYSIVVMRISKKYIVELEFVNEKYMFPVNKLGKQEIKDFYKAVSEVQQNND